MFLNASNPHFRMWKKKGKMNMDKSIRENIAQMCFPNVERTPEDMDKRYPERNLKPGAKVTRFAPSPTGLLHVGGLYSALISSRVARQSEGVFLLRIEDTDKKREVENGVSDLVFALSNFEVLFDEGVKEDLTQTGSYGPYQQSQRKENYQVFAKKLIEEGFAYPCFCSEEDLDEIRKHQEVEGVKPGYYGKWSKYRDVAPEEYQSKLREKMPFVIRLKSVGDPNKTVVLEDEIKGRIELPQNDQDIVLLKSDGIPTYHFAHVVDDHLMRVTTVIRGDEWLPSAPIHLQLFDLLKWTSPKYAHISTIQKEEDGGKRKLSKRKDPEASIGYYHEHGIPAVALTEYLLNIANSNFEDWRRENPKEAHIRFPFQLNKMSVSGAIFDMVKLTNVSKNAISKMSAEEVYEKVLKWSLNFDPQLTSLMQENMEYVINIFNIERGGDKPRKDISKWADARAYIGYFFDAIFEKEIQDLGYDFSDKLTSLERKDLFKRYLQIYNPLDGKEVWFEQLKNLAVTLGFSPDAKTYKKEPEKYKGHVGDVAEFIRVALTNRKNTPDLAQIMFVMGPERVHKRLMKA
jgi:glutamyl-tRNA synthetase